MKRLLAYTLICTCFCLFSCDSFLDIKPKGIIIPERCEDYEKLLNYPQQLKASHYYPNYMTDDVFLPYSDNMTGGYQYQPGSIQNLYTFNSKVFGDGQGDELWDGSYSRIYTYNVIINNVLESTDASENYKKQIRAEALVGRAFEYLTLVNAYAKHFDPSSADTDPGVPLVLEGDINLSDLRRATVAQVYSHVLSDLDEAVENLPENPVLNSFRASKPVAYGMLARMYLYMGKYDKALLNAQISLGLNDFLLDILPYSVTDPDQWIGRLDVPDRADNKENIYLRVAPYVYGLSGMIYGSEELISLFDPNNDQRFLLYFTRYIDGIHMDHDLWIPYLYANMAMSTPEIYLIAAECESRIGSKDKAMEYINRLRDHRIFNNVSLTAADSKEALRLVIEERRRELVLLGCTRLIDLKRLNREPEFAKTIVHKVENEEYKLEPNDPKYVLPIPLNVLRYNPNMEPNVR